MVSRGGRPDLAANALAKSIAPTLLIVGERDEPVIELNQEAMDQMSAEVKELEIIPGATHLFEEPGTLELAATAARDWFQRYLEGELVEFYIEGSGGYAISNIDLISHEIYFTKRDVMAHLEPTIFFSYQTEYGDSSSILRDELTTVLDKFNARSRLPLMLEESHRLSEGPVRLQSTLMRKLRQSLLFIADGTPISQIPGTPPQLLPSPQVCVEVGYALQCKRPEQIILVQMERSDLPGQFPFDLPGKDRLIFQKPAELRKTLPSLVEERLQRFNLLRT